MRPSCVHLSSHQISHTTVPFGDPHFLKELDILLIKVHFLVILTTFPCTCTEVAGFLLLVHNLLPPCFFGAFISYKGIEILVIGQPFG